MFENDLVELDPAGTLAAAGANEHALITAETPGAWHVRQAEPGTWLWRSPHCRIYLVNASGTHPSATPSLHKRYGAPRHVRR